MQGVLLIDKDKGFTSHDVVALCRKTLGIRKIGHCGTLDPMATGVLPILIGKATKLSNYLMGQDKTYEGSLEFGYLTDTLDADGKVLKTCDNKNFEKNEILQAMEALTGEIDQVPPMYSAIKINGKKLYEYAREGKEVERKTRRVKIYSFDLLNFSNQRLDFRVSCSSGTYIRSLIGDLAENLESFATLTSLKRVEVGSFKLEDCHSIEELKEGKILPEDLIPLDKSLDMEEVYLPDQFFYPLIYGQNVPYDLELKTEVKVFCQGKFIGIGFSPQKGSLRVKKRLLEMQR